MLDSNPGLPPGVRRLLRGLLLAAGIGGLVLVTLTGRHHELEVCRFLHWCGAPAFIGVAYQHLNIAA